MSAEQHTCKMLLWPETVGVKRLDLALRRSDGTMIWHQSKEMDRLPLPWARALNVRQAEVYVRPARGESWPLVFLDDVALPLAVAITRKYPPGGGDLSPRRMPSLARLPREPRRAKKSPGPALARSQNRSGSGLNLGRASRPPGGLQELETLRSLGEHRRFVGDPAVGPGAGVPGAC